MKKTLIQLTLATLVTLTSASTHAQKLKVIAAYPYIASITQEIAGNSVDIESLANAKWDPHFITARPSFIAKLRNADLLITNGAELEIGWIPPLVNQAKNLKLGGDGTLDLSRYVDLQEIPQEISRKMGDVHPSGNPHFHLDPYNVIPIAKAISSRLIKLDSANTANYEHGLKIFLQKWNEHLQNWEKSMASLKGQNVVQYHNLFHYFLHRFQISSVATVERLPGIPPTAEHMIDLEKQIKNNHVNIVIQDIYHPDNAAKIITQKLGLKLVYLPHDVGAASHTENIFALFDEIVRLMTHD
ncbi:MAG: zinc ABC transporter substrate-binding protein [Spirochaetia bacterium]|nr:zinc ABC transporter substrate-binding protein [Spirochaetia bacterium]